MGSKTDYLENAVLNYWLRANVGGLTSPATVYVGLFTATPSDTGGGTEVAGSGYARQVIAFSAPSPAGTMVNSAIIDFPAATGSGFTKNVTFPDGIELPAGAVLGISQIALGADVGFDVQLVGFEY